MPAAAGDAPPRAAGSASGAPPRAAAVAPRELTKAFAVYGAAAPAGVFLGGVIAEWLTWRWVLFHPGGGARPRAHARRSCPTRPRAAGPSTWSAPRSPAARPRAWRWPVNTGYHVGSALGLAAMTALAASHGADRLGDVAALTEGWYAVTRSTTVRQSPRMVLPVPSALRSARP